MTFREGDNALVARCAGSGESAVDSLRVRHTYQTPGRAASIALAARPLPNGHLLVEATLLDAQGRDAIAADDRVYFAHDGGGRLLIDRGTPTGTSVIEGAAGGTAPRVSVMPR